MQDEEKKTEDTEIINIKLSKQVLEFSEFYAELGNMDRETLLQRILVDRLEEIKKAVKTLPYIDIPEIW